MDKNVLKIRNITKSFNGVSILSNASADFESGLLNIIIGENASGKSTLIKLISGVLLPDSGTVTYNDISVIRKNSKRFKPKKAFPRISVVYQTNTLIDELTVAENIFLNDFPKYKVDFGFVNDDVMTEKCVSLLKKTGFSLDPLKKVRELTSVQKRMVEIAKALSSDSEIIIMDEPSSNFVSADLVILYELLNKLKAAGKLIMYITHNLNEALEIGDTITVICEGAMLPAISADSANREQLLKLIAGDQSKYRYPYIPKQLLPTILKVDGLETEKIHGVSFELHKGETLGITGLASSHKTEIGHALMGITPILSGTVSLMGVPIRISGTNRAINYGFGYIYEDANDCIVPDFLPQQNMTLSNLESISNASFIDNDKENVIGYKFSKRLSIKKNMLYSKTHYLSRGTKQKICVARALCSNSQILVMEEPTQGIDAAAKSDLYNLINNYKLRGGSIILISSDLEEVSGMSDRVLIIKSGCQGPLLEKDLLHPKTLMSYSIP